MAGFNSISVEKRRATILKPIKGFNGFAAEVLKNTHQNLKIGFNSFSVDKPLVILLHVVNEQGDPYPGAVSITVEATVGGSLQSYTDSFEGALPYKLDAYIEGGSAPQHNITITDGTLTSVYRLTPVLGGQLTLALTRVPITEISLVDAMGNIGSVVQVQNAVVYDATAWDGDAPRAVSFPASGGVSNEPFFYFAREQSHIRLSADITYEVVPGRPITESFTNIAIAP